MNRIICFGRFMNGQNKKVDPSQADLSQSVLKIFTYQRVNV